MLIFYYDLIFLFTKLSVLSYGTNFIFFITFLIFQTTNFYGAKSKKLYGQSLLLTCRTASIKTLFSSSNFFILFSVTFMGDNDY
ncbi:hypothetical protein BTO30_14415 [Domibacillus antri]|uniref:Uncharacterized protein n=1 Tax=Domibacillus antri TaxID=1714264 RepID=A0A1Q8Q2E4_9BACI|nr:hypothetical protein BTO30_14415 [Domibacillus antri]